MILVQRGRLDEAEDLWTVWRESERRNEQGLPYTTLGGMMLAEASGRLGEAGALAREVWGRPHTTGRLLWALLSAPDVLRVARAADLGDLAHQVAHDVSAIATEQVPSLAGVVRHVRAMITEDSALAAQAAGISGRAGHVVGELYSWEEAAVTAAASGDRDLARTWARRALDLADALGARTVERRLSARLRHHRVRLGATGSRRRPSTGWEALTPTELRVAEQVAAGLTSPQIATQLYLSPRTVQTHITHILRKLDLRSRVELATAWAGRG
jgi:DNA-binding CsgD family transcriptional regulator